MMRPSSAAADAAPDDLVKACVAGQCVVFAGSGLSMEAGLPDWQTLIGDLVQWSRSYPDLPQELQRSLEQLQAKGETDLIIEAIVEGAKQGTALVIDFLRQALTSPPAATTAHDALASIGLSGAITSNWDDLLEHAFRVPRNETRMLRDAERLLEALGKGEFFLLKLYGRLDEPDSVLFTPARYRDAVLANQPFGQFLASLFYSRTLFFVGKNIQGIEDFLGSVPSRSGTPPRHFALVLSSDRGLEVKAQSLKRRFGLEVIPYDPEDGFGLSRRLEALANRVRDRRGVGIAASRGETARLARVAVENIGPFAQLEIDLHPGWNLLLGDNGVGKSSVLKAVAVGIVGDEAAAYASRLVRSGATFAAVTLTTDRGESYRTEIYRSETFARISTVPVRPLEKEGWLALGFPPLRTVSWERPAAYEGGERGRPVPADLLPLVQGDADPRLDRLKAWLLHVDHNIQSQNSPPGLGDRYRRLWQEFFRIVKEVTPGVNLEPGSVDPQARQVYVRTDDGQVPIEAVSQGTQSLMGWIGIVLQRLFEVYGDDADPTQRYALVLMDEIDAHMHPHWQHVLIRTLKRIFPNVQFLASSHSALVVSGLSKDEILVFTRDEANGRRVKVERPPGDLKGWRIDQILTSPAFGLTGARDPDTLGDLERYTELAAQDAPEDPAQLDALAARLKIRLPTPIERGHARRAFEILHGYARSQLEAMPHEERKKVTEELKVQIQESITGSRRPT